MDRNIFSIFSCAVYHSEAKTRGRQFAEDSSTRGMLTLCASGQPQWCSAVLPSARPLSRNFKMAATSSVCRGRVTLFVLLWGIVAVQAWDSVDLELFDLVEEIKDNFYHVLGLEEVCFRIFF